MKRTMDAATLEQRARAVAAQFTHAADSHEPAVAAAASLDAAAGLAHYAAGALEDLYEPEFMRRLGVIAFVPATLVGLLAFGIACALLALKPYRLKENCSDPKASMPRAPSCLCASYACCATSAAVPARLAVPAVNLGYDSAFSPPVWRTAILPKPRESLTVLICLKALPY